MEVVRNDLDRFLQRINKIEKIWEKALDLMLDKGKTLLVEFGITLDKISTEKEGTHAYLSVTDEEIAFIEFGFGVEGSGTYEGELPNEPITFETSDGQHTTQGWVYYYDSKFKATVNGVKGWYYNGEFVTGEPAKQPLWNTAKELRAYMQNGLIKDLKGYLKV